MPCTLVTGGAGFIGSHITRELLKMGHEVVVLDDLSGGFQENVPSEAEFIKGSILDHELLAELFQRKRFDFVYHFAAYAAEGLSHFIKRFNYMNNLVGSVNLINESVKAKVKCFVFTSSIAVYGALKPPMREDMVLVPEDPYGISKWAVEQELRITHEMFGLNYVIFRPHNVYGEYQNLGDRYRNVVGIFMNQLMQNKPLTIFGDGKQTRAFSYIGDISPIVASCVGVPEAINKVFNIGGETPYSVSELAQTVMEILGVKGEIKHVEARNEVIHAFSDHSRAESVFGKRKLHSLPDGLRKMADWAKKAGIRKSTKFENIEITEKLPPIWLED